MARLQRTGRLGLRDRSATPVRPGLDLGPDRPLHRPSTQQPATPRCRPGPVATETLLRQALGDPVTSTYDDTAQAQVMLYVLGELIASEHLDRAGLDAFLAEARAQADAGLDARSDD